MKTKINRFLDWFEEKFNFIVDITALVGSIITILLSIFLFIVLLTNGENILDKIQIVFLPGFIGFLAIIMLFALRITRYITKK